MLPSNSDYVTIAKNMEVFIKDDYLKDGKPIPKGASLLSYTGGFSKVFPVNIGKNKIALRFWTKEIDESKERYREIDSYLKKKGLPYFVGFHYIEDKLEWEGVKYPFIYMDWVTGLSLESYINQNISHSYKIKKLADHFFNMVKTLHQHNIAHGDLQDENILVLEDGLDIELKLIDYDTLYVPNLKNFNIDIMGVEAYQHPNKNNIKKLNEKIDYFSELVIYLSLLAYAEDSSLWDAKAKRQLLFNEKDFQKPLDSKILKQLKNEKYSSLINLLAKKLIEYCQEDDILRLYPLEKLIPIRFNDKDIERAFEAFSNLSMGNNQDVFDEISTFWEDNESEINAKGKIIKYLYFLGNSDKYVLPIDYQKLLNDKDFSFIGNIYSFYTRQELVRIGDRISLKNIVNLAKKGTFSEQKYIQELYYIDMKYLPKDFNIELENNFFETLINIHSFIRKDILEKTLGKLELSKDESEIYIKNLQNSSSVEYESNVNNMVENIAHQYIIPIDYQELIIDKSPSVNYIIANFYSVNNMEKIGKKISVDNIVNLARRGSFKSQKTIEKLNHLEDRYIPVDLNKALENNLFGTIDTIESYIIKDELDKELKKSKLSEPECQEQINNLKNATVATYEKTLDKIKHKMDKDPLIEKMLLELEFAKYSEVVQRYLNKFLKTKSYMKKDDYNIVKFLDSQIKKRKVSRLFYLLINLFLFIGLFFLSYELEWLFPLFSIFSTLFYFFKINKLDNIPKKFQPKITGRIKPKDIRLFSKKIGFVDILLVGISLILGYFTPLIYQNYLPLLSEII